MLKLEDSLFSSLLANELSGNTVLMTDLDSLGRENTVEFFASFSSITWSICSWLWVSTTHSALISYRSFSTDSWTRFWWILLRNLFINLVHEILGVGLWLSIIILGVKLSYRLGSQKIFFQDRHTYACSEKYCLVREHQSELLVTDGSSRANYEGAD